MNKSSDLVSKLKAKSPEDQQLIATLKSENLKLKKHIGKIEAEKISLENDIIILKVENSEWVKYKHKKNLQNMSIKELQETMKIQTDINKRLNKNKKKNT